MQHTVKDTAGRVWDFAVTYQTRRRLLSETGLDILRIIEDEKILATLSTDLDALFTCLLVVTEGQRAERGVSEDEFAAALDADTAEAMGREFMAAVVDFFPQARRAPMRSLLSKAAEAVDVAYQRANDQIQAVDVASIVLSKWTDASGTPQA